jgi:hypothetical protein
MIRSISAEIRSFDYPNYGTFFFTHPAYADVAMNHDSLCIVLGRLRDQDRFVSSDELLAKGLSIHDPAKVTALRGCATVVVCSREEPRCLIYRRALGSPLIQYWQNGHDILLSDNLGLMIDLLPDARFNDAILLEHFMHREVISERSYVDGVARLLPYEILEWRPGNYSIHMASSFNDLMPDDGGASLDESHVDGLFSTLQAVISMHLADRSDHCATALSGGIDSSLIQAAVNSLPHSAPASPSVSYAVQTPSFQYEIDYARDASRQLGTIPHIVEISPADFPDLLLETTWVLGQPVGDDARPSHYALFKAIDASLPAIDTVFNGTFTTPETIHWIQGDKYRHWPIAILEFLAFLLSPVSHPKSYGARMAAETLALWDDVNGQRHPINGHTVYTDWSLLARAFPEREIRDVFSRKRALLDRYIKTDSMMEAVHVFGLVATSSNQAHDVVQMAEWYSRDVVYPYADEDVLRSLFSVEPIDRYSYGYRNKPMLRKALESRVDVSSIHNPKGWSGLGADLFDWMRVGPLRELAHSVDRPGFLDRADFERNLNNPDWFTWSMVSLDLFKKHVLSPAAQRRLRSN